MLWGWWILFLNSLFSDQSSQTPDASKDALKKGHIDLYQTNNATTGLSTARSLDEAQRNPGPRRKPLNKMRPRGHRWIPLRSIQTTTTT